MSDHLPIIAESAPSLPIHSVSVRQLVEFVLRRGDLVSGDQTPRKLRGKQGSQAHRKLQRSRPADYETEVGVAFDYCASEVVLRISGRVDGVWRKADGMLLDEIKTVKASWNRQPTELHWAQLKFYGFFVCEQQQLTEIELQLTYLELPSEQITVFREKLSLPQLKSFFESVASDYIAWIVKQQLWRRTRDVSAEKIAFPYGSFRQGQRTLSAAAYKTVLGSGKLFAEAPTGIGKTMSALFPVTKASGAARIDKIFYLTAKTVTQSIAEGAFADLKSAGLRFRTIVLTAKDKLCVRDGKPCDAVECPFAQGYYDRLRPALSKALEFETLTRTRVEELAREHQLCPHEFSLDVSEWADGIICDYNHAFDPRASLKRHFVDGVERKVLLIDEAHNLLDRARDMFSAELTLNEVVDAQKSLRVQFPKCANALRRFEKKVKELLDGATEPLVRENIPEDILRPIESFVSAAEQTFAENDQTDEVLLQLYYKVSAFLQISEYFDERYRLIIENTFGSARVRLFCLDPSRLLADAFERVDAAVLFSATLTPLDYFRTALGGSEDDRVLKLNSPFPPEHLKLLVAPYIQTSFRHRNASVDEVVKSIETFVRAKQGNYLIYFPSYKYLNEVGPKLELALNDADLLVQRNDMNDQARADFVEAFKRERSRSLVGLAVMGGVFGEGIDLIGERLIGAVIVGVGLPQLCLERDLIRAHFDEKGEDGFAYAYVYPGFNRVLQAVGRVIRSENDKGAVLLIDSRFREPRFADLFPPWWQPTACRNTKQLQDELEKFWADR